MTDADLVRAVSSGFNAEQPGYDENEAKARNKKKARDELGHIETLRQSTAFQWFQDSCIERSFSESRQLLESDDVKDAELPKLAAAFQALRKIVNWLDKVEIQHRRLDNPNDPRITDLRRRIDLH